MDENRISAIIVDAALEVHRTLGGPGLLEGVYRDALMWEVRQRNVAVEREKKVPIVYKGHTIGLPLQLDLLVGGLVIVECKATIQYNTVFESQLLTYLRLTGLKLGLVINFGEKKIKYGIHRV
jgi:GxxExxY protein